MPQSANLLCREMSLLAFNRRVLAQACGTFAASLRLHRGPPDIRE